MHACDQHLNGLPFWRMQINKRSQKVVPYPHETKRSLGCDRGLNDGKSDGRKRTKIPATVYFCRINKIIRNGTLHKLTEEEDRCNISEHARYN